MGKWEKTLEIFNGLLQKAFLKAQCPIAQRRAGQQFINVYRETHSGGGKNFYEIGFAHHTCFVLTADGFLRKRWPNCAKPWENRIIGRIKDLADPVNWRNGALSVSCFPGTGCSCCLNVVEKKLQSSAILRKTRKAG